MQLGIYLNSQHPDGDDPARRLRRDAGTGAPDPLARFRFDLGRRAPRHPGLPLLPAIVLADARSPPRPRACGSAPTSPCCRCTTPSSWPSSAPFSTWQRAAVSCSASVSATDRRSMPSTAFPCAERVGRFLEAIEIIRRLWSEDRRQSCWALLAVQRGQHSAAPAAVAAPADHYWRPGRGGALSARRKSATAG